MKDWSHPRLQNVDAAKDDWDDLAAEAQAAYQRRYASYPDLVKLGRISAEDARADLLAWRAIARDWHWIAYGDGEPADCNTLEQRMKALDTAVERWIDFAANEGGSLFPADQRQGEAICAMRWWAERERTFFCHYHHARERARRIHENCRANGHPSRGERLAELQSPQMKAAA
ncbi:MAG: hypothetical protein BGO57_12425 [Sphingomonadales bacterium 63-6]|nr:MAG: hypothetical protein BGO57_12425 [Sphingomonadales bacterium 63-6]